MQEMPSIGEGDLVRKITKATDTSGGLRKGFDYPAVGVVFLCHDGKGNYLFAKRSKNARDEQGRWDCGGGGIEMHLSVEDNLRKEIQEEYCTDVLDFEFLGYRSVHREHEQGEKSHWVVLDFRVLVDREKVKNGEPNKFDEVGWFRFDELPTPHHSQLPYFLQKYNIQIHERDSSAKQSDISS